MALILREVVGDGEPGRLRADEDVPGGTDGRGVDEGTHRDVDVGAVADQGVEEGAALAAVGVVRLVAAVDQQAVGSLRDGELVLSIPANGLNAEPVVRRQFEQWQFMA